VSAFVLTDAYLTGAVLAFAAMVMFASNILVTKAASNRLDVNAGFIISVVSNLVFATLLFALQLALRSEPLRWDWLGVGLFALAGACSTYLGRWFFFGAIARLGAARASLFHVSSPAFTAIIAWAWLGERLDATTVLGIVATIVGLFLVTTPPGVLRTKPLVDAGAQPVASPSKRFRSWLASGFAVGMGATLAYAAGNVLRGMSVRQWNEPIAGAMLGAVAALGLHLLIGSGHGAVARKVLAADRAPVRLYALGGVLTISAQMCMIASMRYMPIAVATVITLCTPLVVIPASYWLLNNRERIGAATLVGAAFTLVGVLAIVVR
jgi:drug/metabolite transporter (DMT)-like permease